LSDQGSFTAALQRIVTRERSPQFRWSLALGLFVLALVLRYAINDALPPGFPYLTFFPAVIVTTLLAGLWPGIVSAILCGLAAWFFFIAPAYSLDLNPGALTALGFYAFIVTVDIFIIHGVTVTAQHLQAERESMSDLAKSLQQSNLTLAQSEREQQVLSHEIGHRLKNQLSIVQAIVTQSMRSQSDLPTIAKAITDRITVLAEAQDMVILGMVGQAGVQEIVRKVVDLHGDQLQSRFLVDGPPVKLASRPALSLSMILHELGTNATKYGALSAPDGVVRVDWGIEDIDGQPSFVLRWREEGGPPVVEPVSKGFGTRLIRAGLPGAPASVVLEFHPDGLHCQLSADLAAMQSERAA
jgi:two-component sensor histidine kinase